VEVDQNYNLACPASPIHYQHDPVQTTKTSVHGAINMLGLAKRLRARILQASTSEIYGDPSVHLQAEDYWGHVNPVGPRSCYDERKRCAETLFFDYWRQHRLGIKVSRDDLPEMTRPNLWNEKGRSKSSGLHSVGRIVPILGPQRSPIRGRICERGTENISAGDFSCSGGDTQKEEYAGDTAVQRKMHEARAARLPRYGARGAQKTRGGLLVGRGPTGTAGAMANPKLTWTTQRRVKSKIPFAGSEEIS
jgi:GDP-mannose 4,6 dehydratase